MATTDEDEEINNLVRDVVEASKLPPKSRTLNIKSTVAELTSQLYDRGVLPDALSALIDLVTLPSHLDQASLAAIIRNLYTIARIPSDVVVRVLASLGHGKLKPSLTLQAGLIRWLILVYHNVEDTKTLSKAYPALFNLLDSAALRPQLSHLLALITRRKHVKPFRIQALLTLSRQTGNDPCLVGLLRVFKDYYPEIIVGEAVRGKAAAFKHPDPVWRARLDEVQTNHLLRSADSASQIREGFRVKRSLQRPQKNGSVPLVYTAYANKHSVTLEEVESASTLAQNIEKLELPNQLVAVLADPVLQKVLILRPNVEAYQRVANWLDAVLQDVLDGNTDIDTLWEILEVVKEFAVQTRTLPPVLLNFFARFLESWDGVENRTLVLDILAYTPLLEFSDLEHHIFKPLEGAILDGTSQSHRAMLSVYTNILHHWTALLKAADPKPNHTMDTLAALTSHVNSLSQTLLQASPCHETQWAVLDYHEQTICLLDDSILKKYYRIEMPAASLLYNFFFSQSAATVSRLCDMMAPYKIGLEFSMSIKGTSSEAPTINARSYRKAYVNKFNGYLMDLCNCLWRARAFADGDADSHGCFIPRPTVSALETYITAIDKTLSLGTLFSPSFSPILSSHAIERLRELEDAEIEGNRMITTRHAGPVTQGSLRKLASQGGLQLSWQDYRIGVLRSLNEKSLGGVLNMLSQILVVLKDGKADAPQKSSK